MSKPKSNKLEIELPELKKTGVNLSFFLGTTQPEQAKTLGMIKDMCGDILVQNSVEDCAFNPETVQLVSHIYQQTYHLLRQIAA